MDINLLYFLLLGMALGLMLMTAIYNAVLYYYNKESPFLYYALMQVGIIIVLLYDIDVIPYIVPLSVENIDFTYTFFSLFSLFFILMFSSDFLQISKLSVRYETSLKLLLLLIVIDIIYYPSSIIFGNYLFLPILLYVVYLGYLRVRENDTSAKFFLFGWSAFLMGTLADAFLDTVFHPMFLGSVIEAITLAVALSFHIKEVKKEKEQQKELMIHQSKLASMGEMLGNIAHQWKQPLARLGYIFMNLDVSTNKDETKMLLKEGDEQLTFMSETIDDFTNFYAPTKEKESFSLAQEIESIVELVYHEEIEITVDIKENITLFNYKNEFKQVLLNLIVNAKDVLTTRETNNPQISIVVDKKMMTLQDNAGGIDLENIEKIFEPYFTTKEQGLGIGLYMSKMIIEKNMRGKLSVENTDDGAKFTISI